MTRWAERSVEPMGAFVGGLHGLFLRFAAGGLIPASWFLSDLPSVEDRAAKRGRLKIEVVSHCWNYSHLLAYQLSSLVQQPPVEVDVTMTVFFCTEDVGTVELLERFSLINVTGVTWNWRPISRQRLFRRSIGRSLAARETKADWVWFADCDLIFRDGCFDALGEVLQGRQDALVFPREERCTSLLASSDPMLQAGDGPSPIVEINTDEFTVGVREKATGAYQIIHGDIARACGYCDSIRLYQQPSEVWRKTYEDTAFRWLIRSHGEPIDVPGIYRIRHVEKGRYTGSAASTGFRSGIRRFKSWWSELVAGHRSP